MRKTKINKVIIISILYLSIFFLVLLNNIKISLAEPDNKLIVENLEFQFIENSDDRDTMENINSLDIDLPSTKWNFTHIEMNFTDVECVREIVNVEDEGNKNDKFLIKGVLEGFGVQIKLIDITTIFGAYININVLQAHLEDNISIKIRGYDSSTNAPNSSVYGEVKVNHTISDGWNYQNFTSPITLPEGNYSLVMEGSIQQSAAKYYWYYNDSNPNNPDLYISENSGSGWIGGIQGSPFLYKLDQKIIGDFYPNEANMTADIGGNPYKISNGSSAGSCCLKLSDINFSPNNENLVVPINNNKSSKLIFNLSYYIKLKNRFQAEGFIEINEKSDNIWEINPDINRCNYNYSIEFEYPSNWYDLNVSKNGIDVTLTEDIIIDGNFIYILNGTIGEGDSWKLTAKSPRTSFALDVRKIKFELGQELEFSAIAPIVDGNFTFILINQLGIEKDKKKLAVTSKTIEYSYTIPTNAHTGNWTAYVYWNNLTDAGIQSKNFTILDSFISDSGGGGSGGGGNKIVKETSDIEPYLGLIISIGVVVGAVGSLTSYQTVKRIKKKRNLHMLTLYNKFKDNMSLNYIMISDNKSGVNVYEQSFVGKSLDPSLLSGFLDAIRSFGIELTGSYQKSETIKLDYQNSKILMNDSNDFRLIVILSEHPSEDYIKSITNLANEIQEIYGELLKNFKGGDVTMFKGIKELIEKHLNLSFTYPLKILEKKGTKLTRAEKLMIHGAKVIMKQTNLKHFYTTFLMPDQIYDPVKTKTIFTLIDKGIFQPLSINLEKKNNKLKII